MPRSRGTGEEKQVGMDFYREDMEEQEERPPKEQREEGRGGGDGNQEEERRRAEEPLPCPRCESANTKFCYYNNYSLLQPRYFCKACKRYWTKGGALRNVPFGGGCRRGRRSRRAGGGGGSSPPPLLLEGFVAPNEHHYRVPLPQPQPDQLVAAAHERVQQQLMLGKGHPVNPSLLYNGGVDAGAYYGVGFLGAGAGAGGGGGGGGGLQQQGFNFGLVDLQGAVHGYSAALQQQVQQQQRFLLQQSNISRTISAGVSSSPPSMEPRQGWQSRGSDPVTATSTATMGNAVAPGPAVPSGATIVFGEADVGGPWSSSPPTPFI